MATNTSITQTALPDWYTQYAKTLLEKAYGATGQPYQKYDAPRVAGFTSEQNKAFKMVQDNVGNWKPAIDAATSATNAGRRDWTDAGVAESYMSPFTDAVVDDIGTLAGRNLSENLLPQVNRTFVGGGTFGGNRSADFTARAVRDANESALREQNTALQSGYNSAAGIFTNDANRDVEAGQTLAGIGASTQKMAGTDAAAVEAIGAQKQQLAQRSADVAYEDFQRQRDYDLQMAKSLQGIGGTPSAGGTGTSSVTSPSPNNTAQTVGSILGGIGTIGKIFAREGGRIRRGRQPRGIGSVR